jgi:RNA polymerase II subunit A small phosphatase-like protein
VDDIYETAENNYGNLIKISTFACQANDTELLKLMSYLETIKDKPDLRRIEKRGWSNISK